MLILTVFIRNTFRRLDHWIQFGPNKIAESRILFARYGLQRKNANTPLFRELNLVRPPFRAKIVKYLRHIDELREILNMTTYNNERLSRAIQKIRHGEAIVNNRAQWIGELQSHMTRTMFDCFLHANPFRRIFYARIIP